MSAELRSSVISNVRGTEYREDIDGLRGIAVIAVIVFHAHPSLLPGGFAGVDVFFVISGFLITRLMVCELEAGQFRVGEFFARRVRRLLPALLLVMAACVVPAWLWLLPGELTDFARSVWAVSGLSANLHFWQQTGYFAAAAEHHPLLHTWSLSLEEQFYVLFALLVPWCWRQGSATMRLWFALVTVLSLLACEVASRTAPSLNFYVLPTRAWELLAGALTALHGARPAVQPQSHALHNRPVTREGLAAAGVAALVTSFGWFDGNTPFPSVYTLLPVLGTVLIIRFGGPQSWVGRVLAQPALVGVGLVSYSAYLWHQPLFAFARLATPHALSLLPTLALVALSFGLAALSWRWVEQPLRNRQRSPWRAVAGVTLAGLILVNVAAAWMLYRGGAPDRLPQEALSLLEHAAHRNPRQSECMATPGHPIPPAEGCTLGAPGVEPTIALLGDSHADALFTALDENLRRAGLAARFMGHSGCPPAPGLYRVDLGFRSVCDQHSRAVLEVLRNTGRWQTVIVSARWAAYVDGHAFDNGEGGRTTGPNLRMAPLDAREVWWRPADDQASREAVARAFTHSVDALLAAGPRVVVVYPVPEVGWSVPQRLARLAWQGQLSDGDLSIDEQRYLTRQSDVLRALDAAGLSMQADARERLLVRIYPQDLLCGGEQPHRCIAQLDGVPLYYDDNHLNTEGARLIVQRMASIVGWSENSR